MSDRPTAMTATSAVLYAGYAGPGVAATVGFIADGDRRVVTDPGMVRDRSLILDPLAGLGVAPEEVTDVVFSHHHPDHTLHAALFPNARVHDHWAIYRGDRWEWRDAEGHELSPAIRLIRTPGHTPEDLTTLAGTPDGVVAFTHLWIDAATPPTWPPCTPAAAASSAWPTSSSPATAPPSPPTPPPLARRPSP